MGGSRGGRFGGRARAEGHRRLVHHRVFPRDGRDRRVRMAGRSVDSTRLDVGKNRGRGNAHGSKGRGEVLMALVQRHDCRREGMRCHSSACEIREGAPAPFGGLWVIASTSLMRLRGLARRSPDCTVMVFPRCNDVHTFTMAHPIDVAFVDKQGRVLRVHRSVPPRVRLHHRSASLVVERFARDGPWFERGDQVLMAGSRRSARRADWKGRGRRWN